MKKIAIIGAGPAGLVSAKECLEAGLDVTVFERQNKIGGLWNCDTGPVWQGMKANLSKDTCRFPDFDYQRPVEDFPSAHDIVLYLQDYAYHFELFENCDFRFEAEVTKIERVAEGWRITTGDQSIDFDGVVVGSGFFSTAFTPKFLGREEFQGEITHSSEIREFDAYQGQKVHVIGNGFSGCDIAVGLAKAGAEVTHMFRRPYWLLPRHVGDTPIDHIFYNYPDPDEAPKDDLSLSEQYQRSNQNLSQLCARQLKMENELVKNPDGFEPPFVSITDGYMDMVESGKITLSMGENIHLGAIDADDVICATGFKTNLSFLASDILRILEYDPDDQLMPALLSETGQHPELEGASFVGMYKGPYFLTMALQAQMAAKSFAGLRPASDRIDIENGIKVARALREQRPRPQFPYGDYVQSVLALASKLGIKTPEDGVVLPVHFISTP
ncbi:MAG: NAD(P)-binding domain-containing protein [Pseudomonadota bacterium]